ncbi:hypothetical protein HUB97_15545 [Halorubraceae archaeon YAN]|nr:hypothetical protein [Halorubraceae archaeon YAN]
MLDSHSFALCLTHDVDRPYKTYHSLYYALKQRDPNHLKSLLPTKNTYWTFEEILDLEQDLGVRSAFYFLNERGIRERPLRSWLSKDTWRLYAGRYSLSDPAIIDIMHEMDAGGWEVGIHGSYESHTDRDRLQFEKESIERVLGHEITGGRQHYLNLSVPKTWEHHRSIGLKYDASLGSSSEYGFNYGYGVRRPFDDSFVVFPLTLMELALPDVRNDPDTAWEICESLLAEAEANNAVMTVLWHPRFYSEFDYPNYTWIYRQLIETALEMGAWVGPPAELYDSLEHPSPDTESTDPLTKQPPRNQ